MIAFAPALSWGVLLVVMGLAPTTRLRHAVAIGVSAALLVAGLNVGYQMRQPYKTDFAGAMNYLSQVRAEHPDAVMVVSTRGPQAWLLSRPELAPHYPQLFSHHVWATRSDFLASVRPRPGVSVYVWYVGIGNDDAASAAQVIAAGGGTPACASVPITGLVVVRCAN